MLGTSCKLNPYCACPKVYNVEVFVEHYSHLQPFMRLALFDIRCAKLRTAMLLLLWVSFSSASKWRSAMLTCGLALVSSLSLSLS